MTNFTDTYWIEQLDEERREHNQETEGLYKRIAELEQLVRDMFEELADADNSGLPVDSYTAKKRMKELGIDTEGGA